MKLIDEQLFKKILTPHGTFWIRGQLVGDLNAIGLLLSEGKIPSFIEGCFCFIFKDPNDEFWACTDSLGHFPLFYSATTIGPIFQTINDQTAFSLDSNHAIDQVWLHGFSFGDSTTNKNIRRLMPGSLLNRGKVYSCGNIFDCPKPPQANTKNYLDRLIEILNQKVSSDNNVLLLSSGKDSTFLLYLICKLGLKSRFQFLHLHSHQGLFSEVSAVKRLAEEFEITVQYYNPSLAQQSTMPNSPKSYWPDSTFDLKRLAITNLGLQDKVVWTGEINIFNLAKFSPLLYYCLHSESTMEDLTCLRLSLDYLRMHSTSRLRFKDFPRFLQTQPYRASLERAMNHLQPLWQQLEPQPLYTRCQWFSSFDVISHRLYNYSQDTDIQWFHPFADYRLCQYTVHMTEEERLGPNGEIKYLFYNLMEDCTYRDQIWKQSKTGLGVPSHSKFRKEQD